MGDRGAYAVSVRSERWSSRTADLTLPERVAWILGDDEGRPMSTLTEPAGLLVAAAMVELLLDASLLDAGTAYRGGPVEVTDPLLGWSPRASSRTGAPRPTCSTRSPATAAPR